MADRAQKVELIVDDESEGERLDSFIATGLAGVSRSQSARLIRDGRVELAGSAELKSSRRVSPGERYVVDLPEPVSSEVVAEEIPVEILYEDDRFAVIDKPAGMVVHPAPGHPGGTLVNALLYRLEGLSGIGGVLRPGIVHRLDRDTSGVMIVAKSDEAHRQLSEAWHTEAVRKFYKAVVYGAPRPSGGLIDRPIGRHRSDRKRMSTRPDGRPARTRYETLKSFGWVSLLECEILTGRTHQIRVHLQSIGHPVVGDPLYSGAQWKGIQNPETRKAVREMERQALHAHRMELSLPGVKRLVLTSQEPEDFRRLIRSLEDAESDRD
ncbi:MAG: RluA family pseudouridine synthase [Acidobacteria bacterium]|nr:RluA family pseudouridine synthase [Acidobacteriota bacterium]